jgi:hypothetical protein
VQRESVATHADALRGGCLACTLPFVSKIEQGSYSRVLDDRGANGMRAFNIASMH